MRNTDFDTRIVTLRDRARDLIAAGHVTRGLNAESRINRIAIQRAARRRWMARRQGGQ